MRGEREMVRPTIDVELGSRLVDEQRGPGPARRVGESLSVGGRHRGARRVLEIRYAISHLGSHPVEDLEEVVHVPTGRGDRRRHEPSAGLAPRVVAEVFARLAAINATGVTTILVEQNVRAALATRDPARALNAARGHIINGITRTRQAKEPR